MLIRTKQSNTKHGLKASLPRYTILGPVFFDEKFSIHVYLLPHDRQQ